MSAAALPPDEPERLALLRALGLLDTPSEPVFDRVVRLAGKLLGVPMAAFSLVDADRQWFKAKVGRKLVDAVSETVALAGAGGAAGASVRVGASIGVALQAPGRACAPQALIKEADGWMYEAKKAGRGCILPLHGANGSSGQASAVV